ncbi:MAG: hypothetical protein U0172_09335 [Nitrospiraceae bacterium]
MTALRELWTQHCEAEYPRFQSPHQGELMTLDTVISGCAAYLLDGPDGGPPTTAPLTLDTQRRTMLEQCLADLAAILPELSDDAHAYFSQLHRLGMHIRDTYACTS